MKSILKRIGILAMAFAGALSCIDEKGDTLAPDTFRIDKDAYSVIALDQNAQVAFIPVVTNIPEDQWVFESNAEWCRVGRSLNAEKGIMVAVTDNTDKEQLRRAQVSVSAGKNEYILSVVQTGYGPAIIVKDASIGPEGGLLAVDIISNVQLDESLLQKPSFNSEDGENWIRFHDMAVTKGFATTRLAFQIDVNELPDKREATVTLKASDAADSEADTKLVITQNSISITSTEVFSSERVRALQVRDNQVAESMYSNGLNALIDGNYETFYHSLTQGDNGGTVFPLTWEFEFNGDMRIDYLSIRHRMSASGYHYRGQIGEFNVYYKVNPTDEYTFVQKYDFGGRGGYQTANFATPLENASWVKIEILTGDFNSDNYEDGKYICCAEVEFYNSNRAEVNEWIGNIFTDLSCSEIKEGVTKKQIIQMNAVAPYLATNVAMPLFNGTYSEHEKDFRIHSYEPYSDSRVNRKLVMQYYTSMNNPTGVEVHSGQDIIVCVDKIPAGQKVSIAVYGEESEYGPNYGGAGETEYVDQITDLTAGINNVRITADGMLYVMNTTPEDNETPLKNFQDVKVHILPGCGTVQGYFDPARHTDDRYKELLNRCTYKYFVVKGQKCMFLFHTNQLRSDYPNSIRGGIGAWDDLVAWELELMGLDKVEWFNNHMMAVTSTNPDVYMNASNRRVQFNANTISWICSAESLLNAGEDDGWVCNIWGPAHEMGHVNQMAINWRSTTESSNNLFSNYANYKLAGDKFYKSIRSRGERLEKVAKGYADKRPWAILGDGNYQGEDPAVHMRMNWQLWNYYHLCGYKPDFFPALFNYFRNGHQLPNQSALSYYGRAENAGLCQLEYYEACCAVAGQDLTEFFDVWGFFRTIDQTYSQYGETRYTVTDAMINASKARVRDMNLPKAAPIQYLEDRTTHGGVLYSEMGLYTQYRDKVKITKSPSATVSGSKVTLKDCDEAVAVEVRRGGESTGELLYFSNTFSFTSPVAISGNSLWAVQYDGKRVKVSVQ
ncbi:MAG: M60 family metallopeptidase [Bacteroidales bacterium]|nr:M60 family metallopeptidase [Bacteroidales bacterium]